MRLYSRDPLEPAGAIVGVLRTADHIHLAVAYDPVTKAVTFPQVSEAELQAGAWTDYDWAWLEAHLTLTRICKLLTGKDGLAKTVQVKALYQRYVELLQLNPEEERALRSNLAAAVYYLALTGTTMEEVWNIYGQACSLTPQTLRTPAELSKKEHATCLQFKRQLVIATYAVAMKKQEVVLRDTIAAYQAILGPLPEDLDFRKQWLIATYAIAMHGQAKTFTVMVSTDTFQALWQQMPATQQGALLLLLSFWIQRPHPESACAEFLQQIAPQPPERRAAFLAQERRRLYQRIVLSSSSHRRSHCSGGALSLSWRGLSWEALQWRPCATPLPITE